jgi:hypothetical protein
LSEPVTRIADPSFHFGFVGDPRERVVRITMRNDGGEEVLCRNLVFSARTGSPGLRGVPLLSGPNDTRAFGEVVMQRQSQLILPPFSANGEFTQGTAQFVMQLPRSGT